MALAIPSDTGCLSKRLTEGFYAWEVRGRGWQVWPAPVELEPPFRPFLFHAPTATVVPDDGRSVSALDVLIEGVVKVLRPVPQTKGALSWPEPELRLLQESQAMAELGVVLPADARASLAAAEQLLLTSPDPFAYEILGGHEISLQFACAADERERLAEQIRAHAPEAIVLEGEGHLERLWHLNRSSLVVEFGLASEFMRPLRVLAERDADALAGMVAALSNVQTGEAAVLQVLVARTRHPWVESIRRSVMDGQGGCFFENAPEMLPLAKEKIARPLFSVVLRAAAQSSSQGRSAEILRGLTAALNQFARSDSNHLIPLSNEGYPDREHEDDLLARRSRRSGMLLNADELVSLVHLPSPLVRSPRLVRQVRRTKAAPLQAALPERSLVLGENHHAGQVRPVAIGEELRRRHVHVVGGTGTGKSTLLVHLILQDLEQGCGFAVLDPHGDLVEEILGRVPAARIKDVVLVDPADVERPVGFNPLQAHTDLERTLLASDLVAVFKRLSTTWGDQMHSVLGNAITAILESEVGGTIADLRRFLVEPDFRREFLKTVRDPEVAYYWQREFPLLQGKPQAPILTRLDAFLRPKLVRGMVTQQAGLDLGALMNSGKVVLVKLAQGAIGEENAALLGSLFVSKFHQLALARHERRPQDRTLFTLYLDEFQHFITPSMAALLSGARKFGLGLVLAHQELRQLWNQDKDVAAAVLANAGVRVCFRVDEDDATQLAKGLGEFTLDDLKNLAVGEAICRLERPEWSCNLRTHPLVPVDRAAAKECRDAVVASSRERYGGAPYVATIVPVPGSSPAAMRRPVAPVAAVPVAAAPIVTSELAPAPRTVPTLGRGGSQHKYLQHLVAQMAQERGWHAVIEAAILDGANSVDVALDRDGRRVAFQVSVTTGADHELAGIRACLAAGFDSVVLVGVESRTRRRVGDLVQESLASEEQGRIRILPPEEIANALEDLATRATEQETVVRGYRVKVRPGKPSPGEMPNRTVAQTILGALKRLGPPREQK